MHYLSVKIKNTMKPGLINLTWALHLTFWLVLVCVVVTFDIMKLRDMHVRTIINGYWIRIVFVVNCNWFSLCTGFKLFFSKVFWILFELQNVNFLKIIFFSQSIEAVEKTGVNWHASFIIEVILCNASKIKWYNTVGLCSELCFAVCTLCCM